MHTTETADALLRTILQRCEEPEFCDAYARGLLRGQLIIIKEFLNPTARLLDAVTLRLDALDEVGPVQRAVQTVRAEIQR